MNDLSDARIASPPASSDGSPKSHGRSWRAQITRAALLITAVLSFVAAWNPYSLVILRDFPWALPCITTLSIWAVLTALADGGGRFRNVRIVACWIGATLGSFALVLALVGIFISRSWFPMVREESLIRVDSSLAVHRRVWNSRPFHTCVVLEVRKGSGWSTRFGPRTRCPDQPNERAWVVSASGTTVVVSSEDGAICTYSIDSERRRLTPIDSAACSELGI